MPPRNTTADPNCPCGSGLRAAQCCVQWTAAQPAPDAERLMRSRYSAYVRGDVPHLLATWHPSSRPATLDLDAGARRKWIGLEVRRHEVHDADHATVEFIARYTVGGRAHRLHETSRFERIDGRWYYVDGKVA